MHDKAKLKRKTLIWVGRKQVILDSIQANTPHQTFGIKPKGHTFIFLFLVYKQNHLFFSKSWLHYNQLQFLLAENYFYLWFWAQTLQCFIKGRRDINFT